MDTITFFDYMQPLYQFLHSIRRINEPNRKLISFDLKLPLAWSVQEHMDEAEAIFLKLQDSTVEVNLWSFVSDFTDEGVNKAFDRIIYIIDKNIEAEKKQELLEEKINELKNRFAQLSLEELEQLKFTTKDEKEPQLTADVGTSEERAGA